MEINKRVREERKKGKKKSVGKSMNEIFHSRVHLCVCVERIKKFPADIFPKKNFLKQFLSDFYLIVIKCKVQDVFMASALLNNFILLGD